MGTNNSASDAATAQQAAQQKSIQDSVAAITKAYNSPQRTAQYDQYGQNLLKYYTNQVNTQEATNARNLKFANARSGLTGGSASVDSNTQLQKDYTQGLLQASQQAQAGKSALQQSDINAKNQLISLAQQGNYTGTVPMDVASAQNANLTAAKGYTNANALNNLFSGTAGIYQNEQVAAANRKAQINPIGSLYGTSAYSGSATGAP